jgi:hypothetical protein
MELKASENSMLDRERSDIRDVAESESGALISHRRYPTDGRNKDEETPDPPRRRTMIACRKTANQEAAPMMNVADETSQEDDVEAPK